MLKLRRGVVVVGNPLTVRVDGEERPAWADEHLVGEVHEGDEVIVNVEGLDLELGSGGFDIVHANLTRGMDAATGGGEHVMKLNYTPLQHAVQPVESPYEGEGGSTGERPLTGRRVPALVLALHGQLAPAVWAAARVAPGIRVGFVQTAGGALPGRLSRDVAQLRERGLLCGHITAGPAYGGEREAISVVGAMRAAVGGLGWEAIVAGPGPGILGSATEYGHGGMAALDSAHAALSLGLEALICPRLSSGDPRPRHRGLSHHSEAVLRLLLAPVRVPVPEAELAGWPTGEEGEVPAPLDALREACGDRHDVWVQPVDLDAYASSGLQIRTMGREIADDPLFFAAALAAGAALGAVGTGREVHR